jgi:plastocyanin
MITHRRRDFGASVLSTVLFLATSFAWAGDVAGKVTAQGLRSPENIAVYIDSIPGKSFPAPTQHAVVDQSHLTFVPHVLIVLKGTTIDFKNDDPSGHNIFWPSIDHNRRLAHNMGTWPQGASKAFTFNDLGEVPLLCNVHPQMSGFILVVPTPYFALTDKQGNFDIKNAPPGQYALKTWSADAQPLTQTVTVGSGTTTVNLSVHL